MAPVSVSQLAADLDVGFVVLTHGTETRSRHVVAQLVQAGVAPDRVVVVHNPVRASDRIEPEHAQVRVLRMTHNVGYAPAMNAGLSLHLSEGRAWAGVFTHDVHLRPGCLAAWLEAAGQEERYGALAPVLYLPASARLFSAGGGMSRFGWAFHRQVAAPEDGGRVARSDWLDGAAILFRASALQAVGLYREDLYAYAEDSELAVRLRRAGWPLGVVVAAEAEQEPGDEARPGSHAYLLQRNTLLVRRELAGPAGVAAGLLTGVGKDVRLLARAVRAPTREGRVLALNLAVATAAGMLDFVRGRVGPPPRWLPELGDARPVG